MSFHEVPIFNVLTGQKQPYKGFGEIINHNYDIPHQYLNMVAIAVERLDNGFGISCHKSQEDISIIEKTIEMMWKEKWNPRTANVNLFTTDFGCAVTEVLRESLLGAVILRSDTDLSHTSIWWPSSEIEVFPFHAVYRRLIFQEGESLTSFTKGIFLLVEKPSRKNMTSNKNSTTNQ